MSEIHKEKKLIIEKRNSFRVYLPEPLEGTGKIITVDKENVALRKRFPLRILDLSVSGAKISSSLDFPIEREIIIELTFEVEQEEFTLLGQLLRKKHINSAWEYGIRFMGMLPKDERRLAKILNVYQVKKIKIEKDEMPRFEVPKPIIKVIDLLPYPSYIINEERLILAANKKAKVQGFPSDCKCFNKIFQRDEVCPFCRLNEIKEDKDVTNLEVNFGEKKCWVSWFWLEPDLYLHCINC